MTTPTRRSTENTFSSPQPAVQVNRTRRLSTETKASWKTTEFWIYIAAVVGVLIASQTVGSDSHAANNGNAGDYFRADKAWLYIVLLTIGYQFSRGLAKSGSRDFYDNTDKHDNN